MPSLDGDTAVTGHKTIVFDHVAKGFEGREVLRNISFELRRGEAKILLGIAGSGKRAVLKLALGLIMPDAGSVFVLGHQVSALQDQDLFELRRNVGIVFHESALFDSLTVEDN